MGKNVYNIAVVVDYFVSNQPEIEECYNLVPVIKNLRQNADLLNSFPAVCKKAKVNNFRFYDLRHTCATRIVNAGVDIVKLRIY